MWNEVAVDKHLDLDEPRYRCTFIATRNYVLHIASLDSSSLAADACNQSDSSSPGTLNESPNLGRDRARVGTGHTVGTL